MLSYQATDKVVNLSFSKDFLSPEMVRFIENLHIKELLLESQMSETDALELDDEIKEAWWKQHQHRFLEKIR